MHVIAVARSHSQEGCGECVARSIVRMSQEIKSIAEEAAVETTFPMNRSDFAGYPFVPKIHRNSLWYVFQGELTVHAN